MLLWIDESEPITEIMKLVGFVKLTTVYVSPDVACILQQMRDGIPIINQSSVAISALKGMIEECISAFLRVAHKVVLVNIIYTVF